MTAETELDRRAAEASLAFGHALRARRRALRMTQDDLALATGVGRRFIIDLEAGKPTAQIGRGLLVAKMLGFNPCPPPPETNGPALPDMEDDDGEPANLL